MGIHFYNDVVGMARTFIIVSITEYGIIKSTKLTVK